MRRGRRTIERRYEGWQDAMRERGPFDTDGLAVEVEDWLPELGATAIEARIREKGLDFTAILAAGDSLAVGAAIGLERLGYKVPDDVSVMGIDDLPQAAFHNPPLTTMHVPMREIGAAALNLLIDDLSGSPTPPRRVELACHLVERQSTSPPQAAAQSKRDRRRNAGAENRGQQTKAAQPMKSESH
jgi:DNA-binding LacI/PurR family transcriptional regulator